MKLDAFATQPHYAAHLAPIWWALPAEVRGDFYAAGALDYVADGEGLPGWRHGYPRPMGRPVLIAGYVDEIQVPGRCVYVEHGAGQTYRHDYGEQGVHAYSGSLGHDQVMLFVCPGTAVAERWAAVYPHTPTVEVGCPRMDGWHRRMLDGRLRRQPGKAKTVAFTFHSEQPSGLACREAHTAWEHYADAMPAVVGELRGAGWQVLGTGHPRLWRKIAPWWATIGVEAVYGFDEILARADVLAFDNTSAGPEFASTGRPVVFINSPAWRRDVEHGGRFWDWPQGQISVDRAADLPHAVELAFEDYPAVRAARQRMVDSIYLDCDGRAAERAARAILSVASTPV